MKSNRFFVIEYKTLEDKKILDETRSLLDNIRHCRGEKNGIVLHEACKYYWEYLKDKRK